VKPWRPAPRRGVRGVRAHRPVEAGLTAAQLGKLRERSLAGGGEAIATAETAANAEALRLDSLNFELHERYWAIASPPEAQG
jgi:hypothetical protein